MKTKPRNGMVYTTVFINVFFELLASPIVLILLLLLFVLFNYAVSSSDYTMSDE
jgi:hypothetical protein